MPAQNYVLLERVTVGETAVSSITFNSIPQTGYTDLKIVASTRGTAGALGEANKISFNGDTTNGNYTQKRLLGTGSAASSQSQTARETFFNVTSGATANTFANSEIYIPNYTSANAKSVSIDTVTENNATEAYAALIAVRWSGTAAITSINFTPEAGGNFAQYSSFSLYGLAAVGTTPTKAPKASGGSIIQTDGTYWYHAFLASGTFTPSISLTCDVLVVAGAGGGGRGTGAGGGAGGLSYQSGRTVASAVSLTVGAGGAAGGNSGGTGTNTVFDTITSNGGGGGSVSFNEGITGGSAGGGLSGTTKNQGNTGGATGYGNNSGSSAQSSNYGAGGGGGAGAAGANGTTGAPGAGGAGLSGTTIAALNAMGAATSTGQLVSSNYFYAGGGGGGWNGSANGGAGGSGGGGSYNNTTVPNGTPNTGGGGGGMNGGSFQATTAGAGGSGIIVIRYAV